MYTLEDLTTSVKWTLRMPSVTNAIITEKVNAGYSYISSQVLLTALESSGVANTTIGSNTILIPADWQYHRNLFSCEVEGNGPITILNSREHLRRIYPDFDTVSYTGSIKYITISGSSILYYPIPSSSVELNCRFYKKTTDLEAPIDGYSCGCELPEVIPYGLQAKLLESYVCWQIWASIEDGIEGRKVNTAYYLGQFKEAMDELEDTTEVGQSRRLVYRDANWI